MCGTPALYRLSFILPDNLYQLVPRGTHAPCLHGCLLSVHGAGLVTIQGRPRDVVFEQAQRFLRVQGRGHGRLSIAASLTVQEGEPEPAERWLLSAGRARRIENSAPMLPGLANDDAA